MHQNTDTITSSDLPRLRRAMLGYADDEVFSDEFRNVCRSVVDAIDQASDDESTHAILKSSLDTFVSVGEEEVIRCARIEALCHKFADANESAGIRDALLELIPLLPPQRLWGVSHALLSVVADESVGGAIDFGLADMLAGTDQVH